MTLRAGKIVYDLNAIASNLEKANNFVIINNHLLVIVLDF